MHHVVTPSSGQHWDVLDGLRGVAILMVVASHGFYVNPRAPEWLLWVHDLIGAGSMGVQMFFVLSGFLISYPFLKSKQGNREWYQRGYATRRCLKIIPPYVLCILLLSVMHTLDRGNFTMLGTGLLWLAGIPHFVYFDQAYIFNGSFWSLWVEIGFYVLLPFCFWWTRNRSVLSATMLIGALLLVGSLLGSYLTWPTTPPPPGHAIMYLNARFPNGLTNFAWGVLFAGLFVAQRDRPAAIAAGGKFGYAGMLLLCIALSWKMFAVHTGMLDAWFVQVLNTLLPGGATFFLLFLLFDTTTIAARMLSLPWLRYLGVISYEWFLLHQPVLLSFRVHAGSAKGNLFDYLLIVVTPMMLTLIAAGLMYRFFSAPIIEWGRARLARGQNAEARPIQRG